MPRPFRIACLAALCGVALTAQAQNLLSNPDFDTDVTGWTPDAVFVTGTFDDEDSAGAPDSGSLLVVNADATAGSSGVSQCVTVPESDGTVPYSGTTQARVSDGKSGDGSAVLVIWFLNNDTCDFGGVVLGSVAPSRNLETWGELGVSSGVYPAGTRSVLFDLRVDKFSAGNNASALFDHAYLPEPAPTAAAAVAMVALAALRRRR